MDQRLTRQARNEAIIREVNERIEQLDKAAEEASVGSQESFFEFLCECGGGNAGDIGCEERIPMTISEYENVRSQNDRFAVYPGHEREELEWVADRNELRREPLRLLAELRVQVVVGVARGRALARRPATIVRPFTLFIHGHSFAGIPLVSRRPSASVPASLPGDAPGKRMDAPKCSP
jgi:hypothetical protein